MGNSSFELLSSKNMSEIDQQVDESTVITIIDLLLIGLIPHIIWDKVYNKKSNTWEIEYKYTYYHNDNNIKVRITIYNNYAILCHNTGALFIFLH